MQVQLKHYVILPPKWAYVSRKTGEVLYRKAEQLFSVADELKAEMDDLRGMSIGRLNLGAAVDWQYHLPGYLDRFKQSHPGVEISMSVFPAERVERMVLDRTLDLGFIGGEASKFDLASEHLIDDEIVPICSKGHRLARKIGSEVAKLDEESFIVIILNLYIYYCFITINAPFSFLFYILELYYNTPKKVKCQDTMTVEHKHIS